MAKLTEELWNILQELKEEEFKTFKWLLKQNDVLEGFSGIRPAQLEKADRQDTVDLIVQKYQDSGALRLTLTVLEKISRNDLVLCLQNISSLKDLKSHDPVPVRSDCERQKAELEAKTKLMIQERQMKIMEIKRSAELSSKSADRHISDTKKVFALLLQHVERTLADLIKTFDEKRKIRQEKAEKMIEELEREISELKRRSNEIEALSVTEDHLNFFKSFLHLSASSTTKDWTEVTVPSYGGSLEIVMDQLKEKLRTEQDKLIAKAKLNRVREFAKDVTLDPDTANPYLIMSEDGKQVYCGGVQQNLPDNPKRFNSACNVLGKTSFSSGRFYYQVQVEGKTSWDLGVIKESIDRKGSIQASPKNGFWTIRLRSSDENDACAANLSPKHQAKTVGVFVDYEKGSVSFYDVDSAEVIDKFTNCSFTETLYPFFSPGRPHGGKNSTPLIITPVKYID